MIKPEQLKVGLLIWWSADRERSASWDCPGVITKVDLENNIFSVRTFDTMNETRDLLIDRPTGCDRSSLLEMRPSNKAEVLRYLSTKESNFASKISDAEQKVRNLKTEAQGYSEMANTLRRELEARKEESDGILPKT